MLMPKASPFKLRVLNYFARRQPMLSQRRYSIEVPIKRPQVRAFNK